MGEEICSVYPNTTCYTFKIHNKVESENEDNLFNRQGETLVGDSSSHLAAFHLWHVSLLQWDIIIRQKARPVHHATHICWSQIKNTSVRHTMCLGWIWTLSGILYHLKPHSLQQCILYECRWHGISFAGLFWLKEAFNMSLSRLSDTHEIWKEK